MAQEQNSCAILVVGYTLVADRETFFKDATIGCEEIVEFVVRVNPDDAGEEIVALVAGGAEFVRAGAFDFGAACRE